MNILDVVRFKKGGPNMANMGGHENQIGIVSDDSHVGRYGVRFPPDVTDYLYLEGELEKLRHGVDRFVYHDPGSSLDGHVGYFDGVYSASPVLYLMVKWDDTTYSSAVRAEHLRLEGAPRQAAATSAPTSRIEITCGCGRKNDVGVKSCWWCGNEPGVQ